MPGADMLIYIKFLNDEINVNLCKQALCVDFGGEKKEQFWLSKYTKI